MSTRPSQAVLVASVCSTLIFTPADLPVGQMMRTICWICSARPARRRGIRCNVNCNFASEFRLIWVVQSPLQKYFASHPHQISGYFRVVPARQRGVRAIVTNVGHGMRWTRHSRRRTTAARGRRSRVVLAPRRWCQGRGAIRERRWQESPVTGESTK